MTGVLIADEQGLGKTVQALACLEATQAFPAVIVVPTSVRLNWRNEIRSWLPHRTVTICYGTSPHEVDTDIAIVGWDTLHAWDKALEPFAVIFDESHLAKNGQTRRTQSAVAIADGARERGGYVIALTGTPVLNRVGELMAQLRIIGRLNEFGGARGFKLNFKTPESRPMLNRQLRARCFLRRRKDDVLTELPPKRYAQLLIEGDPKVMTKYRQAEEDIVNYLAEIVRTAALASGLDTESARKVAGEKALRAQSAQHLVAITTLKQIAVEAKRHAIDQWLKEFTATGKKVVVFGWHRPIVEWVADTYADGCRIQGGMSDAEKQASIDKFQNDETQQVISCSIKAAGVGITLTSASDVLFMEQGWNPADQDQCADRCHRIGQLDSVTVYTALCSETVDEDIYDLIQNKRVIVDAITDGTVPDPEQEQSVLGELLVRLANKRQ